MSTIFTNNIWTWFADSVLMNLKLVSKGGGETAMKVEGVAQIPKNGIEELLKASCYTRDESPRIEELE